MQLLQCFDGLTDGGLRLGSGPRLVRWGVTRKGA
jgi:hypothetical protein